MVTTITYVDLYAHIHGVHVLYLLFLVEVGVILYILMTGEMPWSSLVSLEVLVETAEVGNGNTVLEGWGYAMVEARDYIPH